MQISYEMLKDCCANFQKAVKSAKSKCNRYYIVYIMNVIYFFYYFRYEENKLHLFVNMFYLVWDFYLEISMVVCNG